MLRPVLRTRVTFGYKHKITARGGGAKTIDNFTSCFAQIVPLLVFPSLCFFRLQAGKTQHVLGTQRVQHFELKKKKTQGTFCLTFSSHYNK